MHPTRTGGGDRTRGYHRAPMSKSSKPYRRFRARGGDGQGDGMDALRKLTEAQRQSASEDRPRGAHRAPHPSRRQPAPQSEPVRAQAREDRERHRALVRAGRSWWSWRGLGGWAITRRVAAIALLALVVWFAIGLVVFRSAVSQSNDRIQRDVPPLLASQPKGMLSSPTNILMIGSDARPGETRSRADTIMVMRLDPDSGKIKYLSIPRDFRVYSGPRLGHIKITESYFHGGQSGVIRAVRRLTGLPIHHVVVINFRGFPKLVDDLGGVTVYNATALKDCPYPGGRKVSFPKGDVTLDGADALVFSRVRKCDSDFARAARQQSVLRAIQKKVLSPLSLWRAPWNGAAVVRTLTTDMSTTELAKMGWLQMRLRQEPGDRIILAGESQVIGGQDFVIGLPDEDLRQIHDFVGP